MSGCAEKAIITEISEYLIHAKHGRGIPAINETSKNLAIAIVDAMGDVSNIGVSHKKTHVFCGAKTFHRTKLSEVLVFFKANKTELLIAKQCIIEQSFDGCNKTFASHLANNYQWNEDLATAYNSIKDTDATLTAKQKRLLDTMISNLIHQVVYHAEVAATQHKAA
ncbi:MAG: hypothetical protein VYA60_09630 [Pseudomonadota bacterium]|nr:hypothetical protein [Pseudomonadota bacterium]